MVDTPLVARSSAERVGLIFGRHGETARQWDWPMLVGEWGAYGHHPATLLAARDVVRLFEQLRCGDTYWAFEEKLPDAPCFRAVQRPYPERVPGQLDSYHYDPQTGVFECAWSEDPAVEAPAVIYLPGWLDSTRVELLPSADGFQRERRDRHPGGSWLVVPTTGRAGQRLLRVIGRGEGGQARR